MEDVKKDHLGIWFTVPVIQVLFLLQVGIGVGFALVSEIDEIFVIAGIGNFVAAF